MIYTNLLLLIGSALAYANYDGQEIWACKQNGQEAADKLHQYDVFSHADGITTLRVMDEKQKAEVRKIADCEVIVKDLNEHMTKYHNLNSTSTLTSRSLRAEPMSEAEFFKDYRSYEQIKTQYKHWSTKYSRYVKFIDSIGKTHEGRDIFALEITSPSSNPNKKNIMYTGGQHAREWISPATVAYVTYNMLKDAEFDNQVQRHLNNFVYRIVPIVNPDGYEYSRNGDRFWRKNRRNNGRGVYGVDLNRNWDYKWAKVGSSTDPTSEAYHGPSAESEPEVKAVAAYMKKVSKAYGAIDWHSYSQVAGWSWGWTRKPSSNNAILKKMGDSVVAAINKHGYTFTSAPVSVLGVASGAADDYMAVKLQAVSMTMELCPRNGGGGFELPPTEIISCASAAYSGHKAFAEFLTKNPNIPPIKDMD